LLTSASAVSATDR